MEPLINRVFHPTDFSAASGSAFAHALAIAIARKTTLTIMNASKGPRGQDWSEFPAVSDTLKRWGLLDSSDGRRDVFGKLSIKVIKVGVDASNPADAILDFLALNPTDLMVMATDAREGLPRLLRGSVAEKVTRVAGVQSLLVPAGVSGFVSAGDGSLSLKRILVPMAETPDPGAAALVATRAAEALGDLPVEIHAMHVGERMPDVLLPESDDWIWHQSCRQGDVIEEIVGVAGELSADLIVMTTDGPDSFKDLFRGSHVQRVIRASTCPVVTIPIPK